MKAIQRLLVLAIGLLCTSLGARAQEKIIIVNGHFFRELPAEVKQAKNQAGFNFFFITSPTDRKVMGVVTSAPLSDEAIRQAIPVEQVAEGEELLRRFNEKGDYVQTIQALPQQPTVTPIHVGDTFPSFEATDIEGRTWTRADIEGRVMVLNLWYTGCGPCRAEMPELSQWKNEMPEVMFFSSTFESPKTARYVLDQGTFNWIHLVNDKQFLYYIGNHGYPLTIVVGKDGRIAAYEYGTSPAQRERLKNVIASLR